MTDPTGFLREEYERLAEADLDWKLRVLEGPSAPYGVVDGQDVLILCSNNYLNLSNHPRVKEAAKHAIDEFGAGSGSVRPIAGNMTLHEELERRIAGFKRADAALVYSAGFTANSGLIPQLVEKGDVVISDELNHGSIIDGVRLTKADRMIYAHADARDLERTLKEAQRMGHRRILVATDGVFSMDGDLAPVDEIVELAEEFGAMTYVDDAHGEGVLGEDGRGITSHLGVEGRVNVEMGTFSKAFGVMGGYVAGSEDLRNFALNKSRTWLLSGSHPPAVAAACIASVDVLETEPRWVRQLWENTLYFKKALAGMGFDTGISKTPITPVIVGESSVAKELSDHLFKEGVFALPIVFPMVARDKARIRTIMNAALTRDDLDVALGAFEKAGKELGIL
ncbi:MAG: glycine C-acetyltransferase [Thermoplasmata archaeon]